MSRFGVAFVVMVICFVMFVLGSRGDGLCRDHCQRIGVVVPVEHEAMDAMLAGFRERIVCERGNEVVIEVQNAQGDLNLQRAIIEKFSRQGVDCLAAIGTDVSLMAMSRVSEIPVLGLDVTDQVSQALASNVTGVRESPIAPSYRFMRQLLPRIKKVAMVYSASDKNYQTVKLFSKMAAEDGVMVQEVMVQSIAEMYVLAKAIDRDVGAIFIAKDHLVASGVPILSDVASSLGVPLITSDEGSVIAGGTLALGNREFEIGRTAGGIALRLLSGEQPSEIAIEPVTKMTLFVDGAACEKEGVQMEHLREIATQHNYAIELVEKAVLS